MVALAGTLVWIGVNFFVWSWDQSQVVLFWQALGMGAVMMAAMFWYVKGATN
jgi:hypothetical protein